jgi:nitrate reductase assembly molybdenum cofactor insertion protein NarJ
MKDKIQYNLLANLFRYPQEGYVEQMDACVAFIKGQYPEAYVNLKHFQDIIHKKEGIHEIEELFGKTFHIQAICYLDLGYVLYAEDYKRGEFLVQMKNEQRLVNNDCGVELPDNLPNALTLLPLLKDPKFLEELVVRMYIPALEMMVKEFETSRIALKTKVRKKKQKVLIQENLKDKNAFQFALQATLAILQADFHVTTFKDMEIKPDPLSSFLPNCEGSCATPTEDILTTEEPVKIN